MWSRRLPTPETPSGPSTRPGRSFCRIKDGRRHSNRSSYSVFLRAPMPHWARRHTEPMIERPMHNKKREKHLGGGGMQRPPEVVALRHKGRRSGSTAPDSMRPDKDSDHHGEHQRNIEQHPPRRAQGASSSPEGDRRNRHAGLHARAEPPQRQVPAIRARQRLSVAGSDTTTYRTSASASTTSTSHERPTFRAMPTSATTRTTGISIQRFKLASDAWW